jgi:hypothetical protein
MKPAKTDEKTLRQIIERMPPEMAKVVREAAKKHGLLPGGGNADDKPDKDDKPKEKRP